VQRGHHALLQGALIVPLEVDERRVRDDLDERGRDPWIRWPGRRQIDDILVRLRIRVHLAQRELDDRADIEVRRGRDPLRDIGLHRATASDRLGPDPRRDDLDQRRDLRIADLAPRGEQRRQTRGPVGAASGLDCRSEQHHGSWRRNVRSSAA
jgi:hypothetical protein